MTAPVQKCQPTTEPVRRLVNGEFYAKRDKIFRAPIETKTEGGTRINIGFPVCHVSDYVDADNLVECLNASREVDGLKARAEQAERSVDVLESNARVQAKLLADTGRRVEELEAAQEQFISDLASSVNEISATYRQKEVFKASLRYAITHAKRLAADRAALPQSSAVARAPTNPKEKPDGQ